jgi:ketosteroid isomerase-like protein
MSIRFRTIAAGGSLALAAGLGAQAAAPAGPTAPIHQFIDSFNKGDVKAAEAAHTADAVMIDEVPPHVWRGPKAFQDWAAALDKDAKAKGQTDEKVTLGQTVRSQVDGDTAYVVIRATFTYNEKGKPMSEPAQMAFALHKVAGAWKISGWAWTGTVPHAAGGAAKPKT